MLSLMTVAPASVILKSDSNKWLSLCILGRSVLQKHVVTGTECLLLLDQAKVKTRDYLDIVSAWSRCWFMAWSICYSIGLGETLAGIYFQAICDVMYSIL